VVFGDRSLSYRRDGTSWALWRSSLVWSW